MAIVNVTPDSFHCHCSSTDEAQLLSAVGTALQEGADIIDLGACSTRPGSTSPSAEDEWLRLEPALRTIRRAWPEVPLSLDTFRADIAERAIEQYGVNIINDISGGELDSRMYEVVAQARVPYILTHMRGTPATMQTLTDYQDLMSELIDFFARRLDRLHRMGVADVVVDPGFGFSKTMEQNYLMLRRLREFSILDAPLLVGVSRKSMLTRPLGITHDEALNATTAAHMLALERGAHLLRVHDVRAAREAIQIHQLMTQSLC